MMDRVYKTAQTNGDAWKATDRANISSKNVVFRLAYPSYRLLDYADPMKIPLGADEGDSYLVDADGECWGKNVTAGQIICRIGGAWTILPKKIDELLEYMSNNIDGNLSLRKIYASVAAMTADVAAPMGDDLKPILKGQLVVISQAGADMGKVYRWKVTEWEYVATIGDLSQKADLASFVNTQTFEIPPFVLTKGGIESKRYDFPLRAGKKIRLIVSGITVTGTGAYNINIRDSASRVLNLKDSTSNDQTIDFTLAYDTPYITINIGYGINITALSATVKVLYGTSAETDINAASIAANAASIAANAVIALNTQTFEIPSFVLTKGGTESKRYDYPFRAGKRLRMIVSGLTFSGTGAYNIAVRNSAQVVLIVKDSTSNDQTIDFILTADTPYITVSVGYVAGVTALSATVKIQYGTIVDATINAENILANTNAIIVNSEAIDEIENDTKISTVLVKSSQSPNFLTKTTGLQTGSGGGVYGSNVYNVLGLRGTLVAKTKWTSNPSASICCSLLKNGVVVYKTSQTIDIINTDTVELTDALDADTLCISIQIDQESFVSAIISKSKIDSINQSIAATNVRVDKPTSVLWKQDLSKDVTDIVGNFTQGDNGITINTVGEFISLNRYYSIDKRLFRCIFSAQSGVIAFGKQEIEGGLTNTFFLNLDIPNGTITLGATTINYAFVVGRKYIVDIKLQHMDVTVSVQDYLSGAKANLTVTNLTTMYDKHAIKLVSGSSQILNMIGVFATVEPPYLLIYGDSITWGAGVNNYALNRYGTLIGEKTGKPYIVSGRSGVGIGSISADNITSWKSKLYTEIQFMRPKYVMITIGTNSGNTVTNLSRVVEQIQAYGSIVILNNIPCRATGTVAVHTNEDISLKNNIIKTVRDKYNLKGCFFELATSINNDGITTDLSLYNQEVYAPDYIWIHPNQAGHQKMYERSLLDVPELYVDAGVSII